MNTFEEPKSIEHAYERKMQLINEIEGIQTQLGNKDRRRKLGSNHNPKVRSEYWEWRTSAQRALNGRLQELRFLKSWLRLQRRG